MSFHSLPYKLLDLLKYVESGEIQLPDFQREWKWDDHLIIELLSSVSLGYPIGVLMMLETGGDEVDFAPKPLSGVRAKDVTARPKWLLLDGQQRMTSLYQALVSGKPVKTRVRDKKVDRWYYINMDKALGDDIDDREEAIISMPKNRKIYKHIGQSIVRDLSTTAQENKEEMFPLRIAYDSYAKNEWLKHYIRLDGTDIIEQLDKSDTFKDRVLAEFQKFEVPVIILKKDTPVGAVCTVFEKVNTAGIVLNVFELLTAKFAATGNSLKDDWQRREDELHRHFVLKRTIASDFLQVIALLATYEKKLKWIGDEHKTPGVSCKRRTILRLTVEEYEKWADKAMAGFKWAAEFLEREGIFEARSLPYRSQLVPLAALHATIGSDIDTHGINAKIRQWYWCGVLGELYRGANETRFARDLEQVVEWVKYQGKEPDTINSAIFSSSRLLTLRTRNSAAYKGMYALLMQDRCKDWLKNREISRANFFDLQIDIHHIFPRAYCKRNSIEASQYDSIINKTAISSHTNRIIGGSAPSYYMYLLEKRAGLNSENLDKIVAAHQIDTKALRTDDFKTFFCNRRERLIDLIEDAMRKSVNVDD